jgi:serine protease Do
MVENGSPAAKAGTREGDIILALDNRKIVSEDDFQTTMRNYSVGDKLNLKLRRNAESLTLSVVAIQFPMEKASALGYRLLGIQTEDLTPDSRIRLNIAADSGALISELNPQSYLAQIGARSGDVIRRINEVPINNSKDFNEAIVKYRHKKSIIVLLQRGDQGYYITIEL